MILKAKWAGLDEAIRNVSALGKDIAEGEVIEKALVRVGQPLKDEIARTAPRSKDQRHMADEFVVRPSKHDREFGRTIVLVGPRAGRGSVGFVAAFVEFGTSRMRARPFIRPAFDAFRVGFVGALTGELQKQFERVVRKYTKGAK